MVAQAGPRTLRWASALVGAVKRWCGGSAQEQAGRDWLLFGGDGEWVCSGSSALVVDMWVCQGGLDCDGCI